MAFLYEEVVLLFTFIHTAEQFRGKLESAGKVSTEIVLLILDCNLEYVFGTILSMRCSKTRTIELPVLL